MIESKVERALASCSVTPNSNCFIAYSGGLDSTVLLHAASRVIKALPAESSPSLKAIHVHHGISENADAWADHCQRECARLNVPLLIEQVVLESKEGSFEQIAREARYAVFQKHLGKTDYLFLAHHCDDQLETILMRIMRGGDASLLSGIPEARRLGEGMLFRPFKCLRREELERYAIDHGLQWIEDESNQFTIIERNRIRHKVLPRLVESAPELRSLLQSVANGHESLNDLSDRMFGLLYPKLREEIYRGEQGISLSRLGLLSREAQRSLLRCWIRWKELPQPSNALFDRIFSELMPAKAEADPVVNWKKVSVRRFENALFLVKEDESGFPGFSGEKPSGWSWMELGRQQKVVGRSKKEWQKRLRIAPWQRQSLFVVSSDSDLLTESNAGVDVIDLKDGRSIFAPPK